MADVYVVNTYREEVPSMRFIGIRYTRDDLIEGSYKEQWQEWFSTNRFERMEEAVGGSAAFHSLPDDMATSYAGLMRMLGTASIGEDEHFESFEYWIGRFVPEDTELPTTLKEDGLQTLDLPAGKLGIAWLKGTEDIIYGKEDQAWEALHEAGIVDMTETPFDETTAFFERYHAERFMNPDEEGRIILDICFYID